MGQKKEDGAWGWWGMAMGWGYRGLLGIGGKFFEVELISLWVLAEG